MPTREQLFLSADTASRFVESLNDVGKLVGDARVSGKMHAAMEFKSKRPVWVVQFTLPCDVFGG